LELSMSKWSVNTLKGMEELIPALEAANVLRACNRLTRAAKQCFCDFKIEDRLRERVVEPGE
jgi:hypothetical protein